MGPTDKDREGTEWGRERKGNREGEEVEGRGRKEEKKKERGRKGEDTHIITWIDTYALNRLLFYLQNAQFGNLIIWKVIKFVVTRSQILRLQVALIWQRDRATRLSVEILQLTKHPI